MLRVQIKSSCTMCSVADLLQLVLRIIQPTSCGDAVFLGTTLLQAGFVGNMKRRYESRPRAFAYVRPLDALWITDMQVQHI